MQIVTWFEIMGKNWYKVDQLYKFSKFSMFAGNYCNHIFMNFEKSNEKFQISAELVTYSKVHEPS